MTQTEALKSAIEFAEYCLEELDLSYMASNQAKRLVEKAKEALAQPEQEPVAEIVECPVNGQQTVMEIEGRWKFLKYGTKLYTTPPQRKPLTDWIDPNDKAQERFLPNIGETVIFCCRGETYIGTHTGGGFQDAFDEENYFNTWSCRWMPIPIPAAHGIKE